jgi:outer membrane immunogenic protein
VGAAEAQTTSSWTGFYGGVNAGVGFMFGDAWNMCRTPTGVLEGTFCTLPTEYKSTGAGFIGGAQAGYNYQYRWAVMGVEVDGQYSSMSSTATAVNTGVSVASPPAPYQQTVTQGIDWMTTFRGRVGIAPDQRLLLYATGGPALAGLQLHSTTSFLPPFGVTTFQNSSKGTVWGFVVGGGVEYAAYGNWSVKGEVLYYDFGSLHSEGGPVPFNFFTIGADAWFNGVITRLGVNYHF